MKMEIGKVPMNKMFRAVKNFGAHLASAGYAISQFSEVIQLKVPKPWKPAGPKGKRRLPRNNPGRTMAKRRAGHHARRARR